MLNDILPIFFHKKRSYEYAAMEMPQILSHTYLCLSNYLSFLYMISISVTRYLLYLFVFQLLSVRCVSDGLPSGPVYPE